MEFLFPPAIWAALITIVFGAIFALLGIVYNSLRGSIQATGSNHDELEERLSTMENRVKTLFAWAFGNSKDNTDEGFAGDIQGKLSSLNEKMDDMEKMLTSITRKSSIVSTSSFFTWTTRMPWSSTETISIKTHSLFDCFNRFR